MQTQFSLSLELTRVLPIISAPVHVLLESVRAVQRSGSDFVTEEDLVPILGRLKIYPLFESTFKTVIRNTTQQTLLSRYLEIVIEGGAGPTLQRSLKDRARFAVVVQLSMLMWTHEAFTLAQSLSTALRLRLQGAPPEAEIVTPPGPTELLGVLKSCQEQTSEFPWHPVFEAVRSTLSKNKHTRCSPINARPDFRVHMEDTTIPFSILLASLDMLAAVQAFPENRVMYLQMDMGLVTMVVWAHHLLGLTVSVNNEVFGTGNPAVVIVSRRPARACLLEAPESGVPLDPSSGLILAVDESDFDLEIDGDVKFPVRGYGAAVLQAEGLPPDVMEDVAVVTVTLAERISTKLEVAATVNEYFESPTIEGRPRGHFVSLSHEDLRRMAAARMVFDGIRMNDTVLRLYAERISKQAFEYHGCSPNLPLPPAASEYSKKRTFLTSIAIALALLILALSTVRDLQQYGHWLLGQLPCIKESIMAKRLREWNGMGTIPIEHDDWYELLGRMMMGSKLIGPGVSCMISNWGWSMYMSTLGDLDPAGVVPGLLIVKPGVPSRNGERRKKVIDGPVTEVSGPPIPEDDFVECVETSGNNTTTRCEVIAKFKSCMIGAMADEFIVTVCFVTGPSEKKVLSGYREMHRLRWNAYVTKQRCNHSSDSQMILPADTGTVRGTNWQWLPDLPRIIVPLVKGNRAAKWLVMIAMDERVQHQSHRNIMLVKNSCLECTMSETCDLEGSWVIM